MISYQNTLDEYLKLCYDKKGGQDLIVPLMQITELKKINEHLSWLTQEARWKGHEEC